MHAWNDSSNVNLKIFTMGIFAFVNLFGFYEVDFEIEIKTICYLGWSLGSKNVYGPIENSFK